MAPKFRSTVAAAFRVFKSFRASVLRRGVRRKVLSFVIVANLLILPLPATYVRGALASASETVRNSVDRLGDTAHLASRFLKNVFRKRKGQATSLPGRLASVSAVQIFPAKFVGYQSEMVSFSGAPSDSLSNIVHGAKPIWGSSNTSIIEVSETGQATLLQPGLAWVTCQYGSARSQVPVLVRSGARPVQTDQQWDADQNGLNTDGTVSTGVASASFSVLLDALSPTVHAQNGGGAGDYLWDYEPNLVGSPRNHCIEPTRFGSVLPESDNFNTGVPVASLAGRGLNVNLALYYNSRIWMQNGSTIYYEPLPSFPATGFYLGFGYIATYTSSFNSSLTGYLLIDTDGTPRYLGQGSHNTSGTYTTSDGTYITFTGSAASGGELTYTNGTSVTMSVVNNYLQPTTVQDRNGNYYTIAYQSSGSGYSPLAIASVTDTLGRIVQFNYTGTSLTSVTEPAVGSGTTTLLDFYYGSQTLSYNFSGLTVSFPGTNSTGSLLTTVENPNTNTGYVYTYSGYGMIDSVSINRQMNGANSGVQSASYSFNYPASGSTQINSAPAFTQRTESPGGTYSYSSSTNTSAQTITFRIARPDGSTMQLTRSTNTSSVANGLMTESQILNSGSASMVSSVFSYAEDPGGSPQVSNVITYDDTNTPVQVNYDYNSVGMLQDRREFGFQVSGAWDVRRRSHVTYTTAGGATLPSEQDVYNAGLDNNDSNDVLIAKTTYTYDNYSALGGMQTYNGQANPPGHLSGYNSTTLTNRGNLTGETQWYDLTHNLSVTKLAQIDIFGNTVVAQLSCCNQKTLTMDSSTYWSNAVQVTKGGSGGPQLTTTNTYDFNTSMQTGMTDPDGLSTGYQYDANLRPTITNLPTGAIATAGYSDGNMYATGSLAYTSGGAPQSVTSTSYSDGWGDVTETLDAAGNQVNMTYDSMGRLSARTNPFPHNGTPGPSTTFRYDALGRRTLATLPDGNTVSVTYSGTTSTITDQVGRQTERIYDGLGRLVTVYEQNPSTGALTQTTNYTYNYLDKLTLVNQSGQLRSWNYALGRKTYENIPEQAATINDGTGTMWTCSYTYTDFGAIATKTDARGAVTTYSYDTMNRLISRTYNTTNAPGVASTPGVTYNFDNSSTSPTQGELLSVSVGAYYAESYSYDGSERPSSVTDTIGSQIYTTSYQYNQANQITQVTYPSNQVLPYLYDSFGRLNSVGGTTGGNGSIGYLGSITYGAAEQMTGFSLGNGVAETLTYDPKRLQMTGIQATVNNTTLMNLTYSYTAAAGQMGTGSAAGNGGQLVSTNGTIDGQTESALYNYDLDGRLVNASQTSNGQTAGRGYTWDVFGNRLAETDTVANTQIQSLTLRQAGGVTTNRISSVNNNGQNYSYTYDAAGNVTSDGSGNTYTYDAENRLVSVGGSASIQNLYDFKNRRVINTEGGATTHYIWHGNHVLAEMNGSNGSPAIDYILFGNSFIATVQANGVVSYLLSDRLSERLNLSSTGSVQGVMATLPFGEDFAESGTQEKHHFTTYDRDATTRLDYSVNRFYGPITGRFLSCDRYSKSANRGNPQTWNRYSYVANDPINMSDPLGLFFSSGGLYNPVQIDMLNTAICEVFPEFCVDAAEAAGDNNGGGGDNTGGSSCTMSLNVQTGSSLQGIYGPIKVPYIPNPNSLTVGQGNTLDYDYYLYEVDVEENGGTYTPVQSTVETGAMTYSGGFVYYPGGKPGVPKDIPNDNPDASATYNNGVDLDWTDTPALLITLQNGQSAMNGSLTWRFFFEASPSIGSTGNISTCWGSFNLTINCTNGTCFFGSPSNVQTGQIPP
jgi:RHS repeat-associated protein